MDWLATEEAGFFPPYFPFTPPFAASSAPLNTLPSYLGLEQRPFICSEQAGERPRRREQGDRSFFKMTPPNTRQQAAREETSEDENEGEGEATNPRPSG